MPVPIREGVGGVYESHLEGVMERAFIWRRDTKTERARVGEGERQDLDAHLRPEVRSRQRRAEVEAEVRVVRYRGIAQFDAHLPALLEQLLGQEPLQRLVRWVQPAPAWSTHTCIQYRV